MAYSGITVSGFDSAFKVDAVQMSDGDARQILAIGTGTSALEEGIANLAHVEGSSIFVKDTQLSSVTQIVDPRNKSKAQAVSGIVGVSSLSHIAHAGIVGVSGTASASRSKAMAVSGVVGVSGITTGVVGVSGSPSATISNVTYSVSSTALSLSGTGTVPVSRVVVPAPGAGKSIMFHGAQISTFGTTAGTYGFITVYFDDSIDDGKTLVNSVHAGVNPITNNIQLSYPVKCGTNEAISLQMTEQATQIYCGLVIYHSEVTL